MRNDGDAARYWLIKL